MCDRSLPQCGKTKENSCIILFQLGMDSGWILESGPLVPYPPKSIWWQLAPSSYFQEGCLSCWPINRIYLCDWLYGTTWLGVSLMRREPSGDRQVKGLLCSHHLLSWWPQALADWVRLRKALLAFATIRMSKSFASIYDDRGFISSSLVGDGQPSYRTRGSLAALFRWSCGQPRSFNKSYGDLSVI